MKILYSLLALMIPIMGFSINEEPPFVKQKVINKAYLVKPDAGINIDNAYGNISVSTWNEDKIELDILIKVSGDSEKWVNRRIEGIDVKITIISLAGQRVSHTAQYAGAIGAGCTRSACGSG